MSDYLSPAPTQPAGPPPPPPPQVWPYAIGGASIAMAASGLLGVLGSFIQIGTTIVTQGGRVLGRWPGASAAREASQLIPMLLLPLVCALLLPAGILLLRRSRLGVRLHMAFAISTIVVASAGPLLAIVSVAAMPLERSWGVYMLIQSIWGASRSIIYPIFLLVWFRRPRIRMQIADWGR